MVDQAGGAANIPHLNVEDPSQVSIGVITAITIETVAVGAILDGAASARFGNDHHPYLIGTLPSSDPNQPHVVAVAQQTSDGTRDAAWLCGHMPGTFRSLRTFAMCGIAGGVPSTDPANHLGLGDIVVATEVIDYRHQRLADGSLSVRNEVQPPGTTWMNADHELEGDELRGNPPWLRTLGELGSDSMFAPPEPHVLPRVHRGRVGSADLLLRDAAFRDGLAHSHRIRAFEMEGAGLAIGSRLGDRSWYMVRGIADHGDNATKNDEWHPFASLAAAAYLRAVLARCRPFASKRKPERVDGLDALNTIADALGDLRVMRDEQQRRAVLDQLPSSLRLQIPENSLGRLHIIETVRTLERHPEGLDALLLALSRALGSRSPEFIEVEQLLRANWTS